LEALKRTRGAQKGPKKKPKRAKRKSMDEMIVREPMLEKRLRKRQVGSEIDDESEFAPTRSVIVTDLSFESAIHNTSNVTNVNGSGNKESTDEFWGNINIPFDTVIELQKIVKAVSKTRTMKTFEEFIDKVVDDHSSQEDTSTIRVFELMKEFNLPSSTVKELCSILFGINRLKNVGVVTRNQAKGKHLLPLTSLKKRIGLISKKCNTTDESSTTKKDNDSTKSGHDSTSTYMRKNSIASDTITDAHSNTTSPVIAEIMTANSTNASEDDSLPLTLLRKKILSSKFKQNTTTITHRKGNTSKASTSDGTRIVDLMPLSSLKKRTGEGKSMIDRPHTLKASIVAQPNNDSFGNFENDIDTLTDEVLNLPREFRPIRLANDTTINSKSTVTSVSVPNLPPLASEIYVDDNTELMSTNDEEITLSCIDEFEGEDIKRRRKKIESDISKLIDMFNLPAYQKTVLPSVAKRNFSANIMEENKHRYLRMVHLGHKLIKGVLECLCPGPSRTQLQKDIITMMTKGADRLDKDSDEARYKKMSEALCKCTKMTKKNTIERKICRALLYNGVTNGSQLEELLDQYEFTFSRGKARKYAKEDYNDLLNGEKISIKKKSFSRIDDEALCKAVDFVLSEDNVTSAPYGTKVIKLSSNESISLPRLQRKRSRIDIIKAYQKVTYCDTSEKQVSMRSMYNILNAVTAFDQQSLYAIDYVQSQLVNESGEMVQDIIDTLLDTEEAKQATTLLTSASYFLKHRYKHHVVLNDNICYHGLTYGLKKKATSTTAVSNTIKINNNCPGCKFPFYVCDFIKKHLIKKKKTCLTDGPSSSLTHQQQKIDNAISVISDIEKKYELYMAHVARCTNQSYAISNREKQIEQRCLDSKGKDVCGLLIMDFKMKFEVQSSRESTVEHFGKRGIGWHGCALIYFLYEIKKDDDGNTCTNDDGTEVYYAKKYLVYIDQILQNTN